MKLRPLYIGAALLGLSPLLFLPFKDDVPAPAAVVDSSYNPDLPVRYVGPPSAFTPAALTQPGAQ